MSSLLSDMLLKGLAGRSGPSLNFNFVDESAFSPQITFTRASTATFFNSSGVLTSAAIDAPRLDYDPSTLTARGLLIEEQRTNIVASSVYTANANGWANGVIGGTGTITAAAVNSPAGTTAGVFNISGLNGSSYVGVFPTVTASANARTGSVFVRNNGGVKFQIRLVFQTGGTFVSYGTEYDFNTTAFQDGIAGTTAPTSRSVTNVGNGWLRITITASDNGTGNTQASLQFFGTATTTNYNYLMWGAQIEEAAAGASAAFSTSYIPTTTTALTRSADLASVNTLSPWFNASEGTLFVDFAGRQAGAQPYLTMLSNTGETERIYQRYVSGQYQTFARVAGVDIAGVYNVTEGSAANAKIASAYNASQLATSTNGQAVTGSAVASLASVPSGLNKLWLGTFTGTSSFANGYLRRITYYPRRLTDDQLQQITA